MEKRNVPHRNKYIDFDLNSEPNTWLITISYIVLYGIVDIIACISSSIPPTPTWFNFNPSMDK